VANDSNVAHCRDLRLYCRPTLFQAMAIRPQIGTTGLRADRLRLLLFFILLLDHQ